MEIGAAIGYGMQKFRQAEEALIGTGSLQKRLQKAYVYLLILNPEHHLPSELSEEFRGLREEIKRAPILSDDEAGQLSDQLINMARRVDREYWKWEESARTGSP